MLAPSSRWAPKAERTFTGSIQVLGFYDDEEAFLNASQGELEEAVSWFVRVPTFYVQSAECEDQGLMQVEFRAGIEVDSDIPEEKIVDAIQELVAPHATVKSVDSW